MKLSLYLHLLANRIDQNPPKNVRLALREVIVDLQSHGNTGYFMAEEIERSWGAIAEKNDVMELPLIGSITETLRDLAQRIEKRYPEARIT